MNETSPATRNAPLVRDTVYLVTADQGEWSDRSEWVVAAYREKSDAEARAKLCAETVDEARELMVLARRLENPPTPLRRVKLEDHMIAICQTVDPYVHALTIYGVDYDVMAVSLDDPIPAAPSFTHIRDQVDPVAKE